jgi:alkyl sulfatase BDS1-like metallo-beta-lactamase superfamily hydrolase
LAIEWVFTDLGHTYRIELRNGVLIQDVDPKHGTPDLTVTLTKLDLIGLLGGGRALEGLATEGDPTVVAKLLGVLDPPTPGFAIVTP